MLLILSLEMECRGFHQSLQADMSTVTLFWVFPNSCLKMFLLLNAIPTCIHKSSLNKLKVRFECRSLQLHKPLSKFG